MTLFGKRIFAVAIEIRISKQDHPGLRLGPNPITVVLIREKKVKFETQMCIEKDNVNTGQRLELGI